MSKKTAILLAIVACLAMAQVGLSLMESFSPATSEDIGGGRWTLNFWDPSTPRAAFLWAFHAAAIGAIAVMAAKLRRLGVGGLTTFTASSLLGTVFIPSAIMVGSLISIGSDHMGWTARDFLAELLDINAPPTLIGNFLTAAMAAGFGLVFGHYLIGENSSPRFAQAIANGLSAIARQMPWRKTGTSARTAEA